MMTIAAVVADAFGRRLAEDFKRTFGSGCTEYAERLDAISRVALALLPPFTPLPRSGFVQSACRSMTTIFGSPHKRWNVILCGHVRPRLHARYRPAVAELRIQLV